MAATRARGRTSAFDPDAFDAFLAAQRDLGTKWAPRYVRIVDALPVGATNKIDKRPLRADRWDTERPGLLATRPWRATRPDDHRGSSRVATSLRRTRS